MKKLIGYILAIVALAIVLPACGGDSYTKRLKREKRTIQRFIADNDIVVLYNFPSDTVFEKNQYYLDEASGVYMQIENKGKGKAPIKAVDGVQGGTKISIRVDSVSYVSDTEKFASNESDPIPMEIFYGIVNTYQSETSDFSGSYKSPALVLPLNYVRNNSKVRLIVPFDAGSTAQKSLSEPFYYGSVTYTYDEY